MDVNKPHLLQSCGQLKVAHARLLLQHVTLAKDLRNVVLVWMAVSATPEKNLSPRMPLASVLAEFIPTMGSAPPQALWRLAHSEGIPGESAVLGKRQWRGKTGSWGLLVHS